MFDSAAVIKKHDFKEIVISYKMDNNKNVLLLFLLVNFTQGNGWRVSHIISTFFVGLFFE